MTKRNNERSEHKQVEVQWRGMRRQIDEELAPLILALWQAGIDTVNCCQENFPGIAWIEFLSTHDAKEFLDRVAVYPDEEDYRRANGPETLYDRVIGRGSEGDWRYDLHPFDFGVDEEIVNDEVVETCIGPADFEFSVSIRFPRTDIPLILERLSGGDALFSLTSPPTR
jgi:hypothetical protein